MKQKLLQAMAAVLVSASVSAQVNSGSNGSDGAFNPATSTVINMADHPTGIYQYTSVNISNGVTVTFIPNANNSPVVWLVQSNCTISGTISVRGIDQSDGQVVGANAGPGGWKGGNGPVAPGLLPQSGFGPGGGKVGANTNWVGGNASYATLGGCNTNSQQTTNGGWVAYPTLQNPPGDVYGNTFEMPLLGGSGGSGGTYIGGGGGGGAMLIVASGILTISGSGTISAHGGNGYYVYHANGNTYYNGDGGGGSGGAIRLIASTLTGNGAVDTGGGVAVYGVQYYNGGYSLGYLTTAAGDGRIRLEGLADTFTGSTIGTTTRGYTGIIFLPTNQEPKLSISSVAGQPVSSNPTGSVSTPDSLISSQQSNPILVVVTCVNVPLNSDIIVEVRPASGTYASAVGHNNSGTLASSTATVLLNMPRGGGTIQAKVAAAN